MEFCGRHQMQISCALHVTDHLWLLHIYYNVNTKCLFMQAFTDNIYQKIDKGEPICFIKKPRKHLNTILFFSLTECF